MPIVISRRERPVRVNPEEAAHALGTQLLERDAMMRGDLIDAVRRQLLAHVIIVLESNLLPEAEGTLLARGPEALDRTDALDSAHFSLYLL